jgi:hypothetical protein
MSQVTKVGVSWEGLLRSVVRCIAGWRPTVQTKETAYSRLLAEHLRQHLPTDAHVECEYRHLGETLDVYIRCAGMVSDDEIFVELKRRLRRKSEFNRLVGQISALDPGKHKIIVVVVGESDAELVSRLRHQFKRQLEGTGLTYFDIPTMAIVEVSESK